MGFWHRHDSHGDIGSDDPNRETGSEAIIDFGSENTGSMYKGTGKTVAVGTVATPFYGVNPARYNGADLEPIPITPVRKQNWPEMQIQLRNGWGTTNFGLKLDYDDYLRLLTDSATKGRNYLIPQPSSTGRAGHTPGPGYVNVNAQQAAMAGSQPTNPGGPGQVANGVDLSGRRYYG